MDNETRHILCDKQKVRAERCATIADHDLATCAVARCKMPALVELAIIRQVNFRHDTEQLTAMNRKRAIIKPPFVAQRRADKYQRQKIGRCRHEAFDRGGNRRVQCILQKQVVDRIARQGQLQGKRQARPPSHRPPPAKRELPPHWHWGRPDGMSSCRLRRVQTPDYRSSGNPSLSFVSCEAGARRQIRQ